MSDLHEFDINLTKQGIGSEIKMDGKTLHGVTSIDISASVHEITTVTIRMYASVKAFGQAALDDGHD